MRIRDDRYLKAIVFGVAHRQAHAIHANRALLHRQIPLASHRLVEAISKSVIPTSVSFAHLRANRRLIDVSLYDVAIQTAIHQHATLQIHLVAHLQLSQVRTIQRLLHSRNRIGICCLTYHRQANAIVRHALINLQLIHERATHRQMQITLIRLQCHHLSGLFHDSREHNYMLFCFTSVELDR